MKVFINVGPHPQYKEITNYPPKGVKYEVVGSSNASIYYSKDIKKMRDRTNKIIKVFGIPRIASYKTKADLIFSTRGIIPITTKPWVAELEHPYAFAGMDYKNWGFRQKAWVKFFLSKENCKNVMLNSNAAYFALKNSFDISKIKSKLDIVYLAIHYKKVKKIKHAGLNLLTITSEVYQRGFNLVKDIYPELKKRYNVNWTIKTPTKFKPEDWKFIQKYGIKIINDTLPEDEMDKLYGSADIFLYPSVIDLNAMVINEAFRAGVPVVSTDTFGLRDKVLNHQTGLTIHDPGIVWNSKFMRTSDFEPLGFHNKHMSEQLYRRLEYMIRNEKERKKMGSNAERSVKSGFLSINVRNQKFKEIFEKAIKK